MVDESRRMLAVYEDDFDVLFFNSYFSRQDCELGELCQGSLAVEDKKQP